MARRSRAAPSSSRRRSPSSWALPPELLAPLTYRGQKQPGLFLSKTDAEKKEFLTTLLDLGKFEAAVEASQAKVKNLEQAGPHRGLRRPGDPEEDRRLPGERQPQDHPRGHAQAAARRGPGDAGEHPPAGPDPQGPGPQCGGPCRGRCRAVQGRRPGEPRRPSAAHQRAARPGPRPVGHRLLQAPGAGCGPQGGPGVPRGRAGRGPEAVPGPASARRQHPRSARPHREEARHQAGHREEDGPAPRGDREAQPEHLRPL
jgi:hypothetical protein